MATCLQPGCNQYILLSIENNFPICSTLLHETGLTDTHCMSGAWLIEHTVRGLEGDRRVNLISLVIRCISPAPSLPNCNSLAALPSEATAPVKCSLHTAISSGFSRPLIPLDLGVSKVARVPELNTPKVTSLSVASASWRIPNWNVGLQWWIIGDSPQTCCIEASKTGKQINHESCSSLLVLTLGMGGREKHQKFYIFPIPVINLYPCG